MSKQIAKGDNLPPLQKRILMHLVKEGPKTINETAMVLSESRNYKPSHKAFSSLKKQNVIREVAVKHYRGKDYSRFWLTEEGIIIALIEDVSPALLFEKIKEIYPENWALHYFLEIASKYSPDALRVAFSIIRSKGRLDPSDLILLALVEKQSAAPNKEYTGLTKIISQHPKERALLKAQIEQMIDVLKQLNESI